MKYPITAQRLKEALNENNMKAQELADKTGINKASISQYINGSHMPSNLSAAKISNVVDVSPLWLMGFDVPKYDVDSLERKLIDLRIDYVNTNIKDKEKLDRCEREIAYYERQIIALKAENEEKSTPDNITMTKALELYESYQKAEPHIKAAVESLLKGPQ